MMKEMENFRTHIYPHSHFNEKYRLIIEKELTENNLNTLGLRAVTSNLLEVKEFVNELKLLTNAGRIYYYE